MVGQVEKMEQEPAGVENGKPDEDEIQSHSLVLRARPENLDEFYGQTHVLGEHTQLYQLLQSGQIPNLVIWGPKGSGKSSLASVIKNICKNNSDTLKFVSVGGSSSESKHLEEYLTAAHADFEEGRKTVIFIDNVHKMDKRLLSSLFDPMEIGEISLVAASTENPTISLNSTLLSRCRIVVFERLETDIVHQILQKTTEKLGLIITSKESALQLDATSTYIDEHAIKWLADTCHGDARLALDDLEEALKYHNYEGKVITYYDIKQCIKSSRSLHSSKHGDYGSVTAMLKAIRGSDKNGTLYWLSRLILNGDSPQAIARHLVRAAGEYVGEADPQAMVLALQTLNSSVALLQPDSDIILAQCATFLATAPKSRSVDLALAKAKNIIAAQKGAQPPVPHYLRGFGGQEDCDDFLPVELQGTDFFSE